MELSCWFFEKYDTILKNIDTFICMLRYIKLIVHVLIGARLKYILQLSLNSR